MGTSTLQGLFEQASTQIQDCNDIESLKEVEIAVFGKKGSLNSALKSIKDLAPEERKSFGNQANQIKEKLKEIFDSKKENLLQGADSQPYDFDISKPGIAPRKGSIHPITQMQLRLDDAFRSIGFEVFDGPIISSEAFAFDNLNFPPDHPARESMDTYRIKGTENKSGAERLCLRPHLTGASVRYMQTHKPPFRFVYPGRVFRNEATDASHERAFSQYEALIVDKEVPFSAGRLLINTILERVFGQQVRTRMRAGFFPFVEPGFEIDMECLVCSGKGCSVCGHSGWVEMMPGGPPHPNVFKAGGIDPREWQGFYINIGLDRLVMMRHGIDDIRLLRSMDLRFFQQF